METKQIEVSCPCCSARLSIDLRTQNVLRSRPKEQVDDTGKPKVGEADWSDAFGKVRAREEGREDKLGSMLADERKRPGDLEERFRAAKKRLEEPGE